jgi:hypothetical protein
VTKHHSDRPFFYIVVVDEDNHAFSVEGPMTDDTRMTDAVHAAQGRGRQVRCFTTSDQSSAVNWGKEMGLALRESIALTPGDLE